MADRAYDPTKDPHLAMWRERSQLGIRQMRCPSCRQIGYKPYIHPDGQIVAEECGRCDHESSCGYHVTPREYYKDKPNNGEHYNPNYVPPPPPPAVKIPAIYAQRVYCMRRDAPRNPLLRYWLNLIRDVSPGYRDIAMEYEEKLKRVLKQFCVGTLPGGYTVWWIVDDRGEIRSGKAMKYKADGHRDKESTQSFRWMHTMAEIRGLQEEGAEYVGCLFGLNQLRKDTKEVHLVESEKTAVLMSMFKPGMTWMATMGLSCLNESRLLPLIEKGVHIVCHPDYDGYEKWTEAVEKLRQSCPKAHIEVSDYIRKAWMLGDAQNADILDIMERDYQLTYK